MIGEPSEEELMEAYVRGVAGAFERLFARVGPRVHGFFMRTFRSTVMADDLMQITFLKVHRSRHTYRPGLALRPWLFTIAARVRIDALRSHYRLVEEWDEEKIARAEAAAAVEQVSADSGDVRERVRAAIDALPETQRVVIQLHRYEGLSFAEIASILASTEGAIRIRAFRAYGALRVALSDLAKPEGMEVA